MAFLSFGLAAENQLQPNIIRVKYEDLIQNTKEEVMRICDFCDLEFEEAMLEGGRGFELANYSREIHDLVGKPPDTSRIDTWSQSFSKNDLAAFESLAGGLLEQLGYDRALPPGTLGPGKLYRIQTGLREFAGLFRNKVSYRPWNM